MSYKRFLIEWLDVHGRRHNVSRVITLKRLLIMGVGY